MSEADPLGVRNEFPVTRRLLYLDAAHQAPLADSVRRGIVTYLEESSASAGPKQRWLDRVARVRDRVAEFLGAGSNEIAFTKNTSEGLNIAVNALPLEAGDNVLLIEGDHPNNAYAWLNLARKGVEVRFISLPDGAANAETFAPHIDERTRAISLSHVMFHAGHLNDLTSIGALCRQWGIYLVVDAMQSVGVLPIDVKSLGISLLSAGCHKGLLTPQGLGLLYADECLTELQPAYLALASLASPPADLIAKPGDLALAPGARRFELGNFNLLGIHALDCSLALIERAGIERIREHVRLLGDRLLSHIDDLGIKLIGPRVRQQRLHIYVLDLPVDEWLAYFDQQGVRVSPERDGIRISFGMFNQASDVDRFAEIVRARIAEQP